MLQRFIGAVTSFLVLCGGTFAAETNYFAQLALDVSRSSISLRQDGNVLPNTGRTAAIVAGSTAKDGTLSIDFAMNGFSRDAQLHKVKAWHSLMEGFERPEARLITKLDQPALLQFLTGAQNVFDLPVALEHNGASWDMIARVSGTITGGSSVMLSTRTPIVFELDDFGYENAPRIVRMHVNLVLERTPSNAPPLLLAKADKAAPVQGLKTVLRPKSRPKAQAPVRVVVAVQPRRAERAKAQVTAGTSPEKEIVKITHTYRAPPKARRTHCNDHPLRVARDTLALSSREPGARIDRAMRKLVQAFNPCRR